MPTKLGALSAALLCATGTVSAGALLLVQPASATDPAGYQNVRINEVTSSNNDTVELVNTGASAVSISGWKMSDDSFSPQTFSPSSTTIAAGGFVTFNSPKGLGDTDKLVIFTADGTVVDRVDWATNKAKPAMARCGGDGVGTWVTLTTATFGGPNAAGCPATLPASSSVHLNEVTSDNSDTVELFNSGTSAVTISSWKFVDNDTTHALTKLPSPSAGTIPAGGYVTFNSSIGLGDNDSLFLVDANGSSIDGVTWATDAAKPSIQRCANGTGAFQTSVSATLGGANDCSGTTPTPTPTPTPTSTPTPGRLLGGGGSLTSGCAPEAPSGSGSPVAGALPWPGGQDVTIADNVCAFTTTTGPEGRDVSGLAFDPTNPSVLWAVKNKSWVFKLIKSGGTWIPDATWATKGKEIYFTGGSGQPDTEGITVAPNGHLFITSERDNSNNTVPKDTVMEFDPASTATKWVPLHQWDMTSQFPQLNTGNKDDANLGFEGVGYVPDSWLTANSWVDPSTGSAYNPSTYPLHGAGLFFAGLEWDGSLHAYALSSAGTFRTLGVVSTGNPTIQDVQYDAVTQRVVAHCDNSCGVTDTFMKINSSGSLVPDVTYQRPSVMPNDNIEGFALAPASTCVNGAREAVWSDDGIYGVGGGGAAYGHALYSGTFPC